MYFLLACVYLFSIVITKFYVERSMPKYQLPDCNSGIERTQLQCSTGNVAYNLKRQSTATGRSANCDRILLSPRDVKPNALIVIVSHYIQRLLWQAFKPLKTTKGKTLHYSVGYYGWHNLALSGCCLMFATVYVD